MKHSHNHSCTCKHEDVKYCSHCYTVYCIDCNQEWIAKSTWTLTSPWYTTLTTGQQLSNPGNGVNINSSVCDHEN